MSVFAFLNCRFNSSLPSKSSPLGGVIFVILATCLDAILFVSLAFGMALNNIIHPLLQGKLTYPLTGPSSFGRNSKARLSRSPRYLVARV